MATGTDTEMNDYDFIIVGAGSAGCAAARKLSDRDAGSILVIEAGGPSERDAIQNPTLWATLWNTDVDYAYKTVPQSNAAGRIHDWPRGRVVGGTSCLNAMQFVRGHRSDFDEWAADGNPGWDFASVLPYFIELEDFEGGSSELHGTGGPMHVSTLKDKTPNNVSEIFIDAAVETGYPANDDINGVEVEGAAWNPVSIKNGVRQDAGRAFLAPILDRANLTVMQNTTVARLLFEGNRCVGVELVSGERIDANKEVLVTAGAIDSPRLLLQSGIGDSSDLETLGIPVVAHLPGVGQNLHDHLLVGVVYEASQPIPPGVNNLSESVLFWRSTPELSGPDIQIAAIHVPFHSAEFEAPANSYTIAPGIVRPVSRGSLKITSAEPGSPLLIDPNYLGETKDVDDLITGIEMSRKIGEAEAFNGIRGREVLPGPDVVSDEALREFVTKAASTYYHPAGTCKMGNDDLSVVDYNLRVRGVDGLRVADASIMPRIVSMNPNASVVMIGYKAGDMIAGDSGAVAVEEIVPQSEMPQAEAVIA